MLFVIGYLFYVNKQLENAITPLTAIALILYYASTSTKCFFLKKISPKLKLIQQEIVSIQEEIENTDKERKFVEKEEVLQQLVNEEVSKLPQINEEVKIPRYVIKPYQMITRLFGIACLVFGGISSIAVLINIEKISIDLFLIMLTASIFTHIYMVILQLLLTNYYGV